MKLLWLCNMMPGDVKKAITGKEGNGLWVDHMLSDLRAREDVTIRVLCPYGTAEEGELDGRCSYRTFQTREPYRYLPELETMFREDVKQFQPNVIHVWGSEYAHTLAMVNGAKQADCLERLVISIQGLCSVYTGHYAEGVPEKVRQAFTLRDFLRQDNILQQQNAFFRRGELEIQALRQADHVIGRTQWDRACAYRIQPKAVYHFCNETLRPAFYTGQWQFASCRKHRIFASSCVYPVKGFHYLLMAMAELVRDYPDITLAVPGRNYMRVSPLRRSSYQKYLAKLTREYGLEDKIEFLGSLDAEGMKKAYLEANVFAMPSTIENSPNSLGEAMLLGVPCVAADVGGVTSLMRHGSEGFVYQSTAPYMLAYFIRQIFAMEADAAALGLAARAHALQTHDPETNFRELMAIYEEIRK